LHDQPNGLNCIMISKISILSPAKQVIPTLCPSVWTIDLLLWFPLSIEWFGSNIYGRLRQQDPRVTSPDSLFLTRQNVTYKPGHKVVVWFRSLPEECSNYILDIEDGVVWLSLILPANFSNQEALSFLSFKPLALRPSLLRDHVAPTSGFRDFLQV
jgi:hypothetical protein